MNETRRNGNGEVLGPAPFDDRSYDDRQLASPYPAQDANLPVDRALSLLDESISTLRDVRFAMRNTAPSKARRAELRRQLSGCLSDIEVVRIAIKE
jgi:hypothetical protein